MRPTITEQLDGLRRILSEVVAPEIDAPYPAEILAGVIATLGTLGDTWFQIPAYLAWEVASIRAILEAAGRHPRQVAVDAGGDWRDLEQEQQRMSALLVEALPDIIRDTSSDSYRQMIAFFRERASRFPFAMAARPVKKEA